jgi:hypothetical protein
MDVLEIKAILRGELLEKFNTIKRDHGLTTDSETIRLCIAKFSSNGEGRE